MIPRMKLLLSTCLVAMSGWASAATPLVEVQTVGVVQQWAPGARAIRVDGVSFQTAADFQVLDNKGRKLSIQSVRPGMRVMVLSVEGRAMQVVVEPGRESAVDKPQR